MRSLRTIAVTFAQYSRIPMPHFEWKEEDMRFSMAAFPLVGAVIGLVFVVLYQCCVRLSVPCVAAALLLTAVPLVITGGFHVDGFMDVCDALSSFRTKAEKLAILKDPHIGAFAVIRLGICGLIYISSLIIILDSDGTMPFVCALALSFVIARGLSALAVLTFRSARREGMLYYEATSAAPARKANIAIVLVIMLAAAFATAYITYPAAAFVIMAQILSFIWYKYISYKEFGGITGDTAGYFVVICETAAAAAGAVTILMQGALR